jgi:hypothetical protein
LENIAGLVKNAFFLREKLTVFKSKIVNIDFRKKLWQSEEQTFLKCLLFNVAEKSSKKCKITNLSSQALPEN